MDDHEQLKVLLTGYTPNPGCVASKILEAGFCRSQAPEPQVGMVAMKVAFEAGFDAGYLNAEDGGPIMEHAVKRYLADLPEHQVDEGAVGEMLSIAQELQEISEKISERAPEVFKNKAEAMEWYEKTKAEEVKAHAEHLAHRLASRASVPGCQRCGDPIKVGVCENCLPDIASVPGVVSVAWIRDYLESALPEYGTWTDDVLEAIHALTSRSGGWVAVSERLPEEDGAYNVAVEDGTVFPMLWIEKEWCLWTADGLTCVDNVTHWQPLPPPPGVKP